MSDLGTVEAAGDGATYSFTVKPYDAASFDVERHRRLVPGRLSGKGDLARPGDASGVTLASIVEHADGSATVTFRAA